MIEAQRRNMNRGYMKLHVWQDAIEYYCLSCRELEHMKADLKRIYWQQTGCVDSIHRNIAEGYCRRTLKEYLQFLNYSMGSVGESVSSLHAYLAAQQISRESFDKLDSLAYKIENGLKKLIEKLQEKSYDSTWQDSFMVQESNEAYGDSQ